ncbi:hypothetical protein [Lentzea kentuckyensis]|uniref:hypothetical protein n=1 Tax=Lentzea kentuckyensis TaxID=360086 RepID=UPI000A39CA9C|nr:hypothetical protein [Lentzea kentuckyensis]
MSPESLTMAAILLIVVPTIEFGGHSLLRMIAKRDRGYLENSVRRHMFRAGHAHAGVWVIFALVALLYVDKANLPETARTIVRWGFVIGPILTPIGFFLSVTSPRAQRPNKMIAFIYLGALSLAVATVMLGIGLLRA